MHAQSTQPVLPDLISWTPDGRPNIFEYVVSENEIRLTTAIANIGEGAMEVRGGTVRGDVQDVMQRIYNDDGSYSDVQAGEFRYHDNHGHTHFEDFAAYRLRSLNEDGSAGDIVRSAEKVSFCLIDLADYDGSQSAEYFSCGQVQGISPGWSDVYDKGLPGQSINIEGLPDGEYWLEIEIDPLDQLRESNETNNSSFTLITVDRGYTPPAEADAFESNDNFSQASILAPPQDFLYENLSIHAAGNNDYFQVTASANGELTFSINFIDSDGDLDLIVYDSNRNFVARSDSVSDNESITVQAVQGEQFFVRVYGYNNDTNLEYSLFVDQAEGTTPRLVNRIDGTSGNDYLLGTSGDDLFELGAGLDVAVGSAGDDIINGGDAGYNQVDYSGSASDYTFARNTDGTVAVLKPNGSDILTDIGGVWFQGELAWYPIEQLIANGGGTGGENTITGTDGNDYLLGTSANDTFNMGAGVDVAVGSVGDDTINGGDLGYNQVDYAGSAADYTFVSNNDGSITVTKPDGVDTLNNVGGVWFMGEEAWYAMQDLAVPSGGPSEIQGTQGDDYIIGTRADDLISALGGRDVIRGSAGNDTIDGGGEEYDQVDYAGSTSEYLFALNPNGTVSATDITAGSVDLLIDIDGIWFAESEEWSTLEDLV